MKWLPKSGREIEPAVLRRLQTFFDRLSEKYPDHTVIHFNRDHKKLAERGTALRRLAGYGEDNDAFFADFGFQYVNALRRQAESHGTYEELFDRLRAAYPSGITKLYEAEPFRSDLSYFARKKRRTAKHILRQAGVLRTSRLEEEKPIANSSPLVEPVSAEQPPAEPIAGGSPTKIEYIENKSTSPSTKDKIYADIDSASSTRKEELERELAEYRSQAKRYTGLRALFGGTKRRRALEARIREIEQELGSL